MKLTSEQQTALREQIEREQTALRDFVDAVNREIAARNGRIAALTDLLSAAGAAEASDTGE
jgi:Asp-tRNA(Asn)/Glu-tRNA(Gln) amidotransferase A subunit family amidase